MRDECCHAEAEVTNNSDISPLTPYNLEQFPVHGRAWTTEKTN